MILQGVQVIVQLDERELLAERLYGRHYWQSEAMLLIGKERQSLRVIYSIRSEVLASFS